MLFYQKVISHMRYILNFADLRSREWNIKSRLRKVNEIFCKHQESFCGRTLFRIMPVPITINTSGHHSSKP